jgi:hypothetical protein
MSNCPVSNDISKEADKNELWVCWGCAGEKIEDDNSTEIKTRTDGYQFICDECLDSGDYHG